jgi:hypothetical protein
LYKALVGCTKTFLGKVDATCHETHHPLGAPCARKN